MSVPLHYPTLNLNQMNNCLASIKPSLGCDLRFRVVTALLLHATTSSARHALCRFLGPIDLQKWLVVLFNPNLDRLVIVPATDLVDTSFATKKQLVVFMSRPDDPAALWLQKLSGAVNRPTLERTFGPTALWTPWVMKREMRKRELEKKEEARAAAAAVGKEQKAQEKADKDAAKTAAKIEKAEEKNAASLKKKAAEVKSKQVALSLTLILTLILPLILSVIPTPTLTVTLTLALTLTLTLTQT